MADGSLAHQQVALHGMFADWAGYYSLRGIPLHSPAGMNSPVVVRLLQKIMK